MRRIWAKWAFFAVLFGVLATPFFLIPSLGTAVFLSPDETAVAVSARVFGKTGAMRIVDPILKDAFWLHPRSFVTVGDSMVPVGFVGFPALLGIIWRILGDWGLALFTPLLAISVLYPLWKFTARFGRSAQIAVTVTWLTFPTVLLYANRGLFPNLPVVCFAVWASYLMWERRSPVRSILGGICAGIALTSRPVEAVWLLVWFAASWRYREGKKQHRERISILLFAGSCLIVLIACSIIAWRTYGSPFAVGYWLRDPLPEAIIPTVQSQPIASLWPFGFHPRNVWYNVKTYLVGYLGPWVIIALIALYTSLKRKGARPFIAVAGWTVLVGVLMYGQALYQDHVGVNIASVGNSFLRYLLPLAPLFAVSMAVFVAWMSARMPAMRARTLTLAIVGVIAILGTWTALQRDDEGIMASSDELMRYFVVRSTTADTIGPNGIIVSERSDKIFFPGYRVASPLPPMPELLSLVNASPVHVMLYSTTLDEDGVARWAKLGVDMAPIFMSRNETLYELFPINYSQTP